MPPRGYRHLSIREEVWALLEEGAQRRGFANVASYIAFLVNTDLALTDIHDTGDMSSEYLYAITRSAYVPLSIYRELYRAAEDAGVMRDGFDAARAYEECLRRALELTRLERGDAEKLCMAIADIALAKAANALVWVAANKCREGFRVEIRAERGRGAEARAKCLESG